MPPKNDKPDPKPDWARGLVKDPAENQLWIDGIITKAQENGEFDDLPGFGKPIPGAGKKDDELWWVRSWLKRNEDRSGSNI